MIYQDRDDNTSASEKSPLRPHPTLNRYYADDGQRATFVSRLFDASAHHYDRVNHLISFGTDRAYRRRALLQAGLRSGMKVLDVACGTGMIAGPAAQIVGPEGRVIGLDTSSGMLRELVRRGRPCYPLQARAEQLPIAESSLDFLSMGYALRHLPDLHDSFGEFLRVLKPGGTVLLLEITTPSSPFFYRLFKLYLKVVAPKIAMASTFNRDTRILMDYFWDTVDQCVTEETVVCAMRQVGFTQIHHLTKHGILSEYKARKP
jgi:demethylmenaquinone methyltransferase/2-methoxy-6-polyprenyl-1,4-benzoquinol methylase